MRHGVPFDGEVGAAARTTGTARRPRTRLGTTTSTSAIGHDEYIDPVSEVKHSRRFGESMIVADLHVSLGEVPRLLEAAISSTDPVDAFLLAAGVSQVVRDALEDDPGSLLRASSVAGASLPSVLARTMTRGARVANHALLAARGATGARRPLEAAADRIDELVEALAESVLTGVWHPDAAKLLVELLRSTPVLNDLATAASITLPSCFRSFDLHPNDLRRLAQLVVQRIARPAPRVLVVGVRTSGSYLAPLLAASLRLDDCSGAAWCTLRPGRTPRPELRQLLGDCANAGWTLVVVDDPPASGGAIGRVAAEAVELGFPRDSICLAFALHEGGAVPARLAGYTTAVLDWDEWDIHRRLGADEVARVLSEHAVGSGTLVGLRPLELPARPSAQSHARAGFTATLAGPHGSRELAVVAEGTGLGYLGRHALAVLDAVPRHLPKVVGFDDGVLVRQWLPEDARVALSSPARMREAVDYVTSRRDALPAAIDAAASMAGRQPVWEVAGRLLAAPYREVGLALRVAALDAAVRTMLEPRRPSIVDGLTGPGAWFEEGGELVKVGFAERAFSHLDLACYDAVYDLAGLTVGTGDPALDAVAIEGFEAATGEVVDAERLLLYRLVHVWDRARLGHLAVDAAETAMARAWQDWCRARLLDGPLDLGTGPWCVLDIDGVLECSRLGAPTMTPASAAGLRAMRAHGFRPLLATGRGFSELQDRCLRYGLLGGVAEYGGVVYDRGRAVIRELVDDQDVAALATLRAHLTGLPGVYVADGCLTMVRAFRIGRDGRRRGLDAATIDAARRSSRGRLVAMRGDAQTDFVACGVDKGRGVRALLELLGEPGETPALCVGDGEPDLPMLHLGVLARVPGNAARLAGGGIVATRRTFQRGFAEAVDDLVGHTGAHCRVCPPAPHGPDGASLITAVLAGLEGGRTAALLAAPRVLRRARAVVAGAA